MRAAVMCVLAVRLLPMGLSRVRQQYTIMALLSYNIPGNTNYRLGGISQGDIHRVRTTHGDIIATSDSGIKVDFVS